jgi:hypothetical protein
MPQLAREFSTGCGVQKIGVKVERHFSQDCGLIE